MVLWSVFSSFCWVVGGVLLTGVGGSPKHERDDLSINNCEGFSMKFANYRSIYVDKYCNDAITAYVVNGAENPLINGIYEKYGLLHGYNKFELVLKNGTVFTLGRIYDQGKEWAILRNGRVLYSAAGSSKQAKPPKRGWLAPGADSSSSRAAHVTVSQLSFPKAKLKAKRSKVQLRESNVDMCETNIDNGIGTSTCDEGESKLLAMLHPAVGPSLGDEMHKRYQAAYPVESITLDGLLNPQALSNALTFLDVPLSSWIGPEEAFYCCEKKYRLNFTKWAPNNYNVAGVHQLLSSRTFIGFIEHLTGIAGLVPMTVDDERMLWAGSSLIAISPGGYLHVHNDFNYQSDLFRRVNVLLYLNKEWEEEWQGHLEMWDGNATRCVQRILPVFNRMSIFTVLDDAFHGHPEPSAAPPGVNRYALQLVYYTRTPPPSRLTPFSVRASIDEGIEPRQYPVVHGAVFQPTCYDTNALNMSNICSREWADRAHSGQPICECNFRTS